jgi:hypothetical protein
MYYHPLYHLPIPHHPLTLIFLYILILILYILIPSLFLILYILIPSLLLNLLNLNLLNLNLELRSPKAPRLILSPKKGGGAGDGVRAQLRFRASRVKKQEKPALRPNGQVNYPTCIIMRGKSDWVDKTIRQS